jgi:hypothetical protein
LKSEVGNLVTSSWKTAIFIIKINSDNLFDQLNEDKKMHGHFMQDNAMAHTANNSMNVLATVFGE